MAVKVFITGATGYIGGDALHAIATAHPEYEITCLVRNSDKGALVASQYPSVRLVYGDLDNTEILEQEAKRADVVLHCAHADHAGAAETLVKGASGHDADKPGFLIHTSGTGILAFEDMRAGSFGEKISEKVYDDWENIHELTSLPDDALHRDVDKIILAGASAHGATLKTAIVSPPTIYGPSRGPDKNRSIQLPWLVEHSLKSKQSFQVNAGQAQWDNVHVQDLSDVYLKLVEAAAVGGGNATWGTEGYYLTENGSHVWGDISQVVADEGHKQGFLESNGVLSLSTEEVGKKHPYGPVLWGTNARGKSYRAQKLLGWKPSGQRLEDTVAEVVAQEAKALGLTNNHAAQVTKE